MSQPRERRKEKVEFEDGVDLVRREVLTNRPRKRKKFRLDFKVKESFQKSLVGP